MILYRDNQICRAEFIYELEIKLSRVKGNVDLQEIANMINDIRTYLLQKDQEYIINQ